ncbi:aminotransferase class III-fold pyridoxal phosphate-dependent enzyme, partial [Mycobacterium tuberculosis]
WPAPFGLSGIWVFNLNQEEGKQRCFRIYRETLSHFLVRRFVIDHVKRNSPALRATLEKLYDLPIVGDIRGEGYFFGIELVKDQATKQTFTDDERARLLGQVSAALFEAGLYCRTDDRGDPVVQVAPPLISGQPEFDTIETILRSVLTDTGRKYLHL